MCPAIISGSSLRTRWSAVDKFYSLSLVTVPEVFAKVNLAQFPSRFCMAYFVPCSCNVPVRLLPSPSLSMHSDDVSETNSQTSLSSFDKKPELRDPKGMVAPNNEA